MMEETTRYVTWDAHKAFEEKIEAEDHRQNKRIDALEDNVKQIQELTVSVREMAVSLGQMTRELEKQGSRLEAIEKEPADKWKQASWIILSVILTAVITLCLTKIGL